jgi:hypothetical protein
MSSVCTMVNATVMLTMNATDAPLDSANYNRRVLGKGGGRVALKPLETTSPG